MLKRFFLPAVAAVLFTACKTRQIQVSNVQAQKNISIGENLEENPAMTKFIEPYKLKLDGEMNEKISHTNIDLTKTGDNSNLGNLLADFTYEGGDLWSKTNLKRGADAALINIGGIRTTIGKGDILVKSIFEVMPFENEVIIVKMKGTDMQGLFDYYAKKQKNNPVSHLYIETDNGRVLKAMINGKELDPSRDYYIVTSDYLALGGDDMKFFSKGEMIYTGIKLRDLFIEYFKKNQEIDPKQDIRLKFTGKK